MASKHFHLATAKAHCTSNSRCQLPSHAAKIAKLSQALRVTDTIQCLCLRACRRVADPRQPNSPLHLSNSPADMRNHTLAWSSGAGVGPSSSLFTSPECEGVARRARMPWISPGRPGPDRATSRKRPSASLRGDEPAPSQRATRQSRLIAFYGVGPDGAVLRREVKPQVPPESVGSTLPPTAAGCRIPPHHHDAS